MVTYKVKVLFKAEWGHLVEALFPNAQHCASMVSSEEAIYSFEDDSVTPADLGPLVRVELISE